MNTRSVQRLKMGLTLVELLVVILIISLLAALLLPAVQYVREASRRAHCANNLHQIYIAIAGYETSYKCFPQSQNNSGSFLVTILPFIEQSELAFSIDEFCKSKKTSDHFNFVLPNYLCTSDPASAQWGPHGIAGANYCGNSGSWAKQTHSIDGIFRSFIDVGLGSGIVRMSDVTDGLSNTDMVSEQFRADGTMTRFRTVWNTPAKYDDRRLFAKDCRAIPSEPRSFGWLGNESLKGTPWIDGNITVTLFNHVCVPNSPSCFNRSGVQTGAASVASNHAKIVNVIFADGHQVAISENIDDDVWFAMGSRDGGTLPRSLP